MYAADSIEPDATLQPGAGTYSGPVKATFRLERSRRHLLLHGRREPADLRLATGNNYRQATIRIE